MSVWIDLVNCFTGRPTRLTIKVETLDKDAVVTQTADPNVTFTIQTQLNSLPNVQPNQATIRHTKTITPHTIV